MTKEKQNIWTIVGVVLVVLAIMAVVVLHFTKKSSQVQHETTPAPEETTKTMVEEKEVVKIVEVEKEITAEDVEAGLCDIGFLATEEYYFTEVLNYNSVKKLGKISLGFTESKFLASYDGLLTAGIDFSEIKIDLDRKTKQITVHVPLAEIQTIDIDPNSFEVFTEKEGLGNKISISDFNDALVNLEQSVAQKAIDRGIIEKATENAEQIVARFIDSLLDTSLYTITFSRAA